MQSIRGVDRRQFLAAACAAGLAGSAARPLGAQDKAPAATGGPVAPLKLGLVTYNLAKSWDVATILKNCAEAKFEAVELRTTHAHGVEVELTAEQRRAIRDRFRDSPVELASLGSAFEFHSVDAAEVRRNVTGAIEYARLAADVGAKGIKVRPNGLQVEKGVKEDDTLRQIGTALAEVGEGAGKVGIEVRVEVHGRGTSRLPNLKKILDHAASPHVFVCWNSNQDDLLDGGLEANFALVRDKIHFVHLRDLYLEEYPFRRLLGLLREMRFGGPCCAEIPESADPLRVMRYFRGLFLAYQGLS